jgi:hypothetical protein
VIPAPEVIVRRGLGKTLIMKRNYGQWRKFLLRAIGAKVLFLQDVTPIDNDL